ncbi:MAG TPA: hypothetical protein VII90_10625, partial [Anaerolineales bacterium]
MRRKYSLAGLMLTLVCAATACNIGTPSPTPGTTPALPTATDTVLLTPTETGKEAPIHSYAVVIVPEGGTLDVHTAAGNS